MNQTPSLWSIKELKTDVPRGNFRSAIFDFDGTISLIRQGWQQVMIPQFAEVLAAAPGGADYDTEYENARNFIYRLTGKQTIFQCMELVEEVQKRGGTPQTAAEYKEEYLRRLMERIEYRRDGLRSGKLTPNDVEVPGALKFLQLLKERGVHMYLASGTDHPYVVEEAEMLGVTSYFAGIFGAHDDYEHSSKEKVIQDVIRTHKLAGDELVGFGDGYVEIENVKDVGGFAVGVASDEEKREGWDDWKVNRLAEVGAHIVIPDFTEAERLMAYLFPQN